MRIAHALQMPALQQGGVEVLVRTLIAEAPADDEIFLISQDLPGTIEASEWRASLSGHLQVPNGILTKSWNPELLEWLKQHSIDICHFHLSGTYGWKARSWSACPITTVARAGIPTVTTNHSATCFFGPSAAPRPAWRKCAALAKVWPGKARQLAAVRWEASVSQHDLAVTRSYFPVFGGKLIQIYHSRLDSNFAVDPAQNGKVVLNVGTIAFHKGQHLLAEAFARVAPDFPDWQLKLVGYFAEQACVETIRTIIRTNGLEKQLHLCGPDPDPTRYFAESEIYVQPSLLEGLGLSLQEAMFHGRACIGSAMGGIPELIVDPTVGILYPGGDIPALASQIARLMGDPAERRRLGAQARASILQRGMTRQAMSATYRKLYQQAIHSR